MSGPYHGKKKKTHVSRGAENVRNKTPKKRNPTALSLNISEKSAENNT